MAASNISIETPGTRLWGVYSLFSKHFAQYSISKCTITQLVIKNRKPFTFSHFVCEDKFIKDTHREKAP